MSAPFRAKRLDLGGFVNVKVIRDHTKRKVFEKHEAERSVPTKPSFQTAPRARASTYAVDLEMGTEKNR
jgi:small subunit ribosomal protein S14